jgi:hypothetical protein
MRQSLRILKSGREPEGSGSGRRRFRRTSGVGSAPDLGRALRASGEAEARRVQDAPVDQARKALIPRAAEQG